MVEQETVSQRGSRLGDPALLVSEPSGVRTIPLPATGTLTIGRSDQCDVVLHDEKASRKHVALRLGRHPTLTDLSSRNGTVVDGKTVTSGHAVALGLGALVQIGSSTLVLFRRPDGSIVDGAEPRTASVPAGYTPRDPAMKRLYSMLDVVGPSTLPVIVLGETGAGKDVFARAIHASSSRAGRPFIAINCSALPEPLVESELFGHERGAFSGAMTAKAGLIEAADGGTLFLDEVADLPLTVQAKLLRVLETREIRRVGAIKPLAIDVRYVVATNKDLQAAVMKNEFRADLFHRLNGFSFVLPPLRERPLDVTDFARRFALALGCAPLGPEVENALAGYGWPGNVRELRTTVERAVALARGSVVRVEHLMLETALVHGSTTRAVAAQGHRSPSLDERERIVDALRQTSGNQKEAAALLGVSRRTLITKIERHCISRPRKGPS